MEESSENRSSPACVINNSYTRQLSEELTCWQQQFQWTHLNRTQWPRLRRMRTSRPGLASSRRCWAAWVWSRRTWRPRRPSPGRGRASAALLSETGLPYWCLKQSLLLYSSYWVNRVTKHLEQKSSKHGTLIAACAALLSADCVAI